MENKSLRPIPAPKGKAGSFEPAFWCGLKVSKEKTIDNCFLCRARAGQGVSEATSVARDTSMLASRRRTRGRKAGYSPKANISTPYALKASFQNYGWDMRTRHRTTRDSELKPSPHRPKSKNIGVTTKVTPIFLVEVAGLELAASSTRNWRATNCATPRNIDFKAEL